MEILGHEEVPFYKAMRHSDSEEHILPESERAAIVCGAMHARNVRLGSDADDVVKLRRVVRHCIIIYINGIHLA